MGDKVTLRGDGGDAADYHRQMTRLTNAFAEMNDAIMQLRRHNVLVSVRDDFRGVQATVSSGAPNQISGKTPQARDYRRAES